MHEAYGNHKEANAAKQHRNYMNLQYKEQKKEFFALSSAQNRIEQLIATPTEMWDKAKQIKRIMRRRGEKRVELSGPEIRECISFWRNMYQTPDTPDLYREESQGQPLDRQEIIRFTQAMPKKKAPGPDGVTAELI